MNNGLVSTLPPEASNTSARYFAMTYSSVAVSLSENTQPEPIKVNEPRKKIRKRGMAEILF
jgi:hypothetical protein